MLVLDGSSGGGQILRTALGLSVITQTPFMLTNIRGGRQDPGLKTQHLEALNAVARLCNAEVEGARLGSKEISFKPGTISERKLVVDIGTAGSVGLVFQTLQLVPYVLKKPLEVHVRGGATYGKWAPPVDYLQRVFLPTMKRFGYEAEFKLKRHGFYPKGGADVTFTLNPWKPKGKIELLEPGDLERIRIISVASRELEKAEVAERQGKAAKHVLAEAGHKAITDIEYVDTANPGSGIVCSAELTHTTKGGDAIGERSVRAEEIGMRAAQSLLASMASPSALDAHASDMIVPFLALTRGSARIHEVTEHVHSNIEATEAFLHIGFDVRDHLITTSG